jgi:hypothetical protein
LPHQQIHPALMMQVPFAQHRKSLVISHLSTVKSFDFAFEFNQQRPPFAV